MEYKDQLEQLVSKEIRLGFSPPEHCLFKCINSLGLEGLLSHLVIHHSVACVCLNMFDLQGSKGTLGQEGAAGLDGEEVD